MKSSLPTEPSHERLTLERALAWIDARPATLDSVETPLEQAAGQVLARDLAFPADRPPADLALIDGYALCAESTLGAGGYNPMPLSLVAEGAEITAGTAAPCRAGTPPPLGADAILPAAFADVSGAMAQACEGVSRGHGLARRGESAKAGELALARGQMLGPAQLALAASTGATRVETFRPPRVAVWLAGAKPPQGDALSTALAAAIASDGGTALVFAPGEPAPDAFDILLMAGRSGWGGDDDAAARLQDSGGEIAYRGVALAPGGSVGLGLLRGAPVLLLPGDPFAALANYEVLAGRLVRRFSGRAASGPGATVRLPLARKISSQVGVADFIPVLCDEGRATPLTPSRSDGLAALAVANGFVLVPAGSEGFAEGAMVAVNLLGRGGWK
jgi:molybdopterin molybdotransferase